MSSISSSSPWPFCPLYPLTATKDFCHRLLTLMNAKFNFCLLHCLAEKNDIIKKRDNNDLTKKSQNGKIKNQLQAHGVRH